VFLGVKMKRVCVVGGGAAGLMAAYAAAKNGHQVVLLEKNEKLGKKIYITGKGRCNFTNDVSAEDFLLNVVRGERFLKGCIYAFPPQKTMDFFEEFGLSIKTERGNRVFPASDHASDVTKTLEKACKSVGVTIKLNEKVVNIISMPDKTTMSDIITTTDVAKTSNIVKIVSEDNEYECEVCIIATGGLSYPTTGSTGDGYKFAKAFSHKVTELLPGLCGLNLQGDFYKNLQGISLKNIVLTAKMGDKRVFSELGETLFTHFGISGPLVLSLSSKINRLPTKNVELFIDFKPALDDQALDKRILRDFEKFKNKKISNAMVELLPQKLIPVLLKQAGIPEDKNVNVLTKAERNALVAALKAFPMKIQGLRGFEEAIITSGGVELSEINPKTMESKLVKGVKFCGEVLDVDAYTGGFNMQIAFATGYAAGNTIE
jgi:predicted Rossmann fold flavoprotein